MADKFFLDTNIIVYTFDSNETKKKKLALDLFQNLFTEKNYFISTQVIQEFCNVALMKMKPILTVENINNFINTFPKNVIHKIERETISKALKIKKKSQLSFWDSMIISAASEAGCNKLYTEDLTHGQTIAKVKIINPFI